MEHDVNEYYISKKEINRRIYAFTTLILSLTFGLVVTSLFVSFNFLLTNLLPSIVVLFIFICIFLIFRLLIIKFFKSYLLTKIYLTSQSLERVTPGLREKYNLKDMKNITTIFTAENKIREISIKFSDNKSLNLDGLENFDNFRNDLMKNAEKHVAVTARKEFLNYDHPLFYVILGLILSFGSVNILKYILTMNYKGIKLTYGIFAVYIFILGVYFILFKPLSLRYGRKRKIIDYIFGITLLVFSVLLCLYAL